MKKTSISILIIMSVIFSIFSISANAENENAIVLFNRNSINLYPNQTFQLLLSDTDVSATFSSSDESVATVDKDAVVTAIKTGTSIITAKFKNGYTSQCTVEVLEGVSPQDISLNFQNLNLTVGETENLKATVYPNNVSNKTIYYASSDTSIATVDENGHIKATGIGVAVISAESSSSAVSKKCIVKVSADDVHNVSSIRINGTIYTLSGKQKKSIIVKLKNSNNTYQTTTDINGAFEFKDVKSGKYIMSLYETKESTEAFATTQISVTSYNIDMTCIVNKSELVVLYQDNPISSEEIQDITLSKSSLILDCGESYNMAFTVRPSNLGIPALISKSSNEDIVKVTSDGTIQGISAGKATVMFSTVDGKISKSCIVTVTDLNSNQNSWIIILVEFIIVITIIIVFTRFYKKFIKEKEKEEMSRFS